MTLIKKYLNLKEEALGVPAWTNLFKEPMDHRKRQCRINELLDGTQKNRNFHAE
jgi:hypothetical protein